MDTLKHTGPAHAGGALTTCPACKAYADKITRDAIAKRGPR